MVSLALIILGIALYTLLLFALKKQGVLSERVSLYGPLVQLHSQAGLSFIERLSAPRRAWRVWGTAGYLLSLVGLVVSFLLIVFAGFQSLTAPETQVINEPRNLLVIPGVNDFLPLAATGELVIGLLLALVVHEGGHAIMCRISDMDVESTGLVFLGPIPFGAFVQPDEDSVERAAVLNRLRMYAGGVMNNVALSVILLVLLAGPMMAFIAPAPGAGVDGVLPESPAETAGLAPGDRIVAVDGVSVETPTEFEAQLSDSPESSVSLKLASGKTLTLDRAVLVTAAPQSLSGLEAGAEIIAVGDTSVRTEQEFKTSIQGASGETVELSTSAGDIVDLTIGALVVPQPDQPLASAGVPTGEAVVVTAIGGESIHMHSDLTDVLEGYSGGEMVEVSVVTEGQAETYTVTLATEGGLKLGVTTLLGVGGVETNDVGISTFPAEQFLSVLKDSGESSIGFFQRLLLTLFLPLASLAGFSTNFPGFTPYVQNFYVVQGAPAAIAGLWFFAASAMFWTIWVNINLAIFNCLPTVLLDGGHIFRDTVKLSLGKLGVASDSDAVSGVIFWVLAITGIAILLVMFAPPLLL
jgi:membrane-associated protease RseP (regulator of RpoE activity)